ncbi:MAG: putative mycofactocin radical SAM maturase MftC [Eubacteriales bacterium SKADARSKE-1]|nr:putative mycofactocin radical SAM maturase MftC [Eubacteriales bacterium SKADARSKE-1]
MKYYPRQAVWEMTLKCNMNCMHCGSRAGKQRDNELTLDECLAVAQQLIDMGLEYITLIGGEIFFKKDWEKVSRKLVDSGVHVNIITNAYNLGDEQFRQLKDSGVKQVAISIDGMENTHNTIRRNPHSFEHILKVMKRLNDDGYYISVVTTLTDLNFDDLEKMYQLFLDKSVRIWQLQLASPMGNASEHLELLIDPGKVPSVTKFIREKNKEGKILLVAGDNVGYYDNNEHYIRGDLPKTCTEFNGCQAGKLVVGVDSVGNVKGCESLYSDEFIEGNLRKDSLYEIWNRDGAFAYNRNFNTSMLNGKCKGCDRAKQCAGGCRQLSNFTSGNKFESIYCSYR